MLKFYYHPTPNPTKVALFLEESGLPYEVVTVDTRKGEQHAADFLAVNPNAKTPAIDDEGVKVFDSNAILLYLSEKTSQFLPPAALRGETLSWLMFIATGIGPYSGQAVHFKHFAPEKIPYAIRRYQFEAERHWKIVDDRLAQQEWMVGENYSLVDMALFGWSRFAVFPLGAEALAKLPNIQRHLAAINARPAAARVDALKDRHSFKSEHDAETTRAMFPHLERETAL